MSGWRIEGTYLEACNCQAICPCRRVDGVPGGRSTYGVCVGALSWHIRAGEDGDLDLSSLSVVLALQYDDDEPGSPWRWRLYIDERASAAQQSSLASIFTGGRDGDSRDRFPWTWKASDLLGITRARIELDHTPGRGWFRVGRIVVVRVARTFEGDAIVSCVIPGHERPGVEIVTDTLRLDDDVVSCDFEGRCGFESTFSYSGPA